MHVGPLLLGPRCRARNRLLHWKSSLHHLDNSTLGRLTPSDVFPSPEFVDCPNSIMFCWFPGLASLESARCFSIFCQPNGDFSILEFRQESHSHNRIRTTSFYVSLTVYFGTFDTSMFADNPMKLATDCVDMRGFGFHDLGSVSCCAVFDVKCILNIVFPIVSLGICTG